jgi:hypothetical protein
MREEEKRVLLSQIITVIKADNEIHKAELELLLGIGRLINIDKDELTELFKNPLPFTPPKEEFDRILQFHRLILMINIDHKVTSEEIDMIKKQGLLMGLHNQQIDAVLFEMKKYDNNMIPPDKLIEIFKVYNN